MMADRRLMRMSGVSGRLAMTRVAACAGVGAMVLLPACTGLEPAAISAGASAAQTGASFLTQGKLSKFEPVLYEDAVAAMYAAVGKLSLRTRADEPGSGEDEGERLRLVVEDEHGESAVIVVERRTLTMTRVQVDVGTFGAVGAANLLMSKFLEDLKARDAYQRADAAVGQGGGTHTESLPELGEPPPD